MPHPSLAHLAHRPWPLPSRPWMMTMRWHDLLFAHWPIDAETMRRLVPAAIDLDLFDGRAWLGVVPFRMTGVRLRGTPALPGPGAFPELNVRTYVTLDGKPGVYFFSLDAASALAVRAARWRFHLPYFDAAMQCRDGSFIDGGAAIDYESRRTHAGTPSATFTARYAPDGEPFVAAPGTFEHWLTERYCLYAAATSNANRVVRVFRGDIHHAPWPLQRARAEIIRNTMAVAAGAGFTEGEPHLLFARYLDVVAWGPERVR